MNILAIPVMMLSLSLACANHGFAADGCSGGDNSPQSASRVSEYPSGPIDGNNLIFKLSKLPADLKEVRLIENGIELSPGISFQVGQDGSLTLELAPKPGMVLLASYCPAGAPVGRENIIDNDSAQILVRQALIESLDRQNASAAAQVNSETYEAVRRTTSVSKNAERRNPSLNLLFQRLRQQGEATHLAAGGEQGPAVSFDGAGDVPLSDPYSSLLGLDSPRSLDRLLNPNGLGGAPHLASMRLLQNRFDDLGMQTRKVKKGKRH